MNASYSIKCSESEFHLTDFNDLLDEIFRICENILLGKRWFNYTPGFNKGNGKFYTWGLYNKVFLTKTQIDARREKENRILSDMPMIMNGSLEEGDIDKYIQKDSENPNFEQSNFDISFTDHEKDNLVVVDIKKIYG